MASVNKAIIVGNLGRDPEARTVGGDRTKTTFSVATSETWVKDGQKQEKTEWHNVVVWGKLAEICAKYLAKGRPVYIEGRITYRTWDKDDGTKGYATEIVADEVKFLGSPADGATRATEAVAGAEPATDEIPF